MKPTQLEESFTFLRPVESNIYSIIYSVIGYVIAIAILIWLFCILRKKYLDWREYTKPRRVAINALEVAYNNWEAEGYTKFAFKVVNVLKTYLTDRFACSAKTQTFAEFELEVEKIELLTKDERKTVIETLKQCDGICFAAEGANKDNIIKINEITHSFILNTWDIKKRGLGD